MNNMFVKLKDIADLTVGYVGNMTKEYIETGVPFFRSLNIKPFYIDKSDLLYISSEFNEKIKKSKLMTGDLVIVRTGQPGTCCVVPQEFDGCNCSDLVIVRPDKKLVNPYYLEAYINFMAQKQINNHQVGAIQKHFNVGSAKEMLVYLPDREKQEKIANIVRRINSKIELNNKINTELESMAKTLYDYWFLQFEFPNEEGKPYKSSGGKMVWNEELKREIPEGWEVQTVKKCIHHINTGLNPRDNFKLGNGHIKYITVKNLTVNGTIDFSDCDQIDEEARKIVHKRSDVSRGDILFASIAPLGRCVIVQENPRDWDINESVFCIRPNLNKVSTELLYMFFMSDYFVKKAEHSSTGSVFNGIRISTLEEMLILIPTKSIKDKFTDTVKNIFAKKYQNEKENQEIISIRDFLLPLLMNGQVGFEC